MSVPASDRAVELQDNFGVGEVGFVNELAAFREECERLAKLDVSEENSGKFSDLINTERKLRQTAGKLHEDEKAPFLAEGNRIDALKRTRIETLATALKAPKEKFDAWALAEDAKREAAAKAAREEADRRRREAEALAAQAQAADPFEAFDAAELADVAQVEADTAEIAARAVDASKTRIASSIGRAVSVRTTATIVIEDYALCFAAVADNKSVKEAIEKAAKALHKVTNTAPPGCRVVDAKAVR